jgi:hypothetical protein
MKRFNFLFLFAFLYTGVLAQTWQTLTPMPFSLSFPVVVVLKGDIHVMGGGASGGATDMHLRYKPSTGVWDTLAPVPYQAQQPAGCVLNNKIHFCGGGFPNSGTPLKKHYYYDLDSNKWFTAAELPVAAVIHKAVSLDGKMYVMTGQPNKQLMEYYDPGTNTWTQLNPLPDANFWYGSVVSTSQAIYRFGGGGYLSPQKAAYIYDKTGDAWNPLPDLPQGLHGADATAINDSMIYITCGYNGGDKNRVWKFNTKTNTYSSPGVMPAARSYHSMVTIDSCIYSIGGNNNAVPAVATSVVRYCPQPNEAGIDDGSVEGPKPYLLRQEKGGIVVELFASGHEETRIMLTDLCGKAYVNEHFNAPVITIKTGTLNASVYCITLVYEGRIYTEKLSILN